MPGGLEKVDSGVWKVSSTFTSCVILEQLFDSSKLQLPVVGDGHENSCGLQ